MQMTRSSGILLHPTSLPETPGIGTIGKQAYRFVDWLVAAKQTLWQILPYGPTGYGDSPYASFSTFAGNPLIIDIDMLVEAGWLSEEEAAAPSWMSCEGYIDYGGVVYWKIPLLKTAAATFLELADPDEQKAYKAFKKENASWLDNYALFMSIKEYYDAKAQEEKVAGAMWSTYWPHDLAVHEEKAVADWAKKHKKEAEVYRVIQYFFFTQWRALKTYANEKGIKIIGDIPIFVAPDSADVWADQRLFQLDKNGRPTRVAGVPPDYFCEDGQLWGNPLYRWNVMEEEGFEWWINRIRAMLKNVDYVRIDHFRGFEAYWSVPAKDKTAINGKWVKGPGNKLFDAILKALGDIPIIAEDLGVITDKVRALRDDFNLPGMRVLQFAFNPDEEKDGACVNSFLPHEHAPNSVVYTGTHDNDTLEGWLKHIRENEPALYGMLRRYVSGGYDELCPSDENMGPALIRLVMSSVSNFAVIPLQDIYRVDNEGRMNQPATAGGHNWQWRMKDWMFDPTRAAWLKEMSVLYDRNN